MTDKTEAQPEALRLELHQECADFATSLRSAANVVQLQGKQAPPSFLKAADLFERAAAELRRQHAEIQQLKAERDLRAVERDGANERVRLMLNAKNQWMDRAKAAEAQLSARQAAPDGWRLVPESPTEEMVTAGQESFGVHDCYYAMLSAAPPPPEREPHPPTRHCMCTDCAPSFEEENTAPEREPKCGCETCRPNTLSDMRFIVCSDCGNKRCPKANHHDNACTNSNAPGQPGSSWEHVKPHGATNDNP